MSFGLWAKKRGEWEKCSNRSVQGALRGSTDVFGCCPTFGRIRHKWYAVKEQATMLSDVRKDSAHVAYHRADGTLIREWDLKKGEKVLYRPRSFDGGHQYTLKIVRFF